MFWSTNHVRSALAGAPWRVRLRRAQAHTALTFTLVLLSSFAALVQPALAAGPATVTVRVEGLNETKLVPTQVTTTSVPVIKDGNPAHSCSGTSAAGALQGATGGNWNGPWFEGLGYSVETIEGESHAFESGSPANYFWSFWLDEKESSVGLCEAQLQSGDRVLLFPACFGSACPPAPDPLAIEAPASAGVDEPVKVTVSRYGPTGGGTPAAEATLTGAAGSLKTDASGQAIVTFSHTGQVTLRAEARESVRTETIVCVHQGNDGTCGSSGSPGSSGGSAGGTSAGSSGVAGSRSTAPFAIVARATGLREGHVYSPAAAPRLLQGKVNVTAGLKDVKLRLTRMQRRGGGRHKCAYYDGPTERFRSMRCGASNGRFFAVGSAESFSYLLPSALAPGRYVLDVQATDAAGDTTTLARGSSRVVFYVS